MTSEQLQPISNWLTKQFRALIWTFLYLKNFLIRKRLEVKGASLGEILLIKGSPINIEWEAFGCHKIAIDRVGVFPGNLKGITYTCAEIPKEIKIIFYGFNAKATVFIDVPLAYSVELRKRLNPNSRFPIIKKTAFGLTTPYLDSDLFHAKFGGFKVVVPGTDLIISKSSLKSTLPTPKISIPAFTQQEFSNN